MNPHSNDSNGEKNDSGLVDKPTNDETHPLDFTAWKDAFNGSAGWISIHPYIIVGGIVALFLLPTIIIQSRKLYSSFS